MRKILAYIVVFISLNSASGQAGKILSYQRISYNVGNCKIPKDSIIGLGWVDCNLGDLDNDGRKEIFTSSANGLGLGYILSLNSDGTIFKHRILGKNYGLPSNATSTWMSFGESCANIGDLDEDGINDLAIGNGGQSGYGGDVFIIFLNANATIKSYKVIGSGKNGFGATFTGNERFGSSITCLGDIDQNSSQELVIGAHNTSDGASEAGAIWIISLDSSGYCTDYKKISHTNGGGNVLGINKATTRFGYSSTIYDDVDGDGIKEFFIGAPYASYYGQLQGKFYGISINANKTLKSFRVFSDTSNNFGDTIVNTSFLSRALCNLGDIDGNGVSDIAVSTPTKGGVNKIGHVRLLFMDTTFRIKNNIAWDSALNGAPSIEPATSFGLGMCALGDINGDGKLDALVGSPTDYKDANLYGAMYIFFLDGKVYPNASKIIVKPLLKMYPNPSKTGTDIRVEIPMTMANEELHCSIVNPLGQVVYKKQIEKNTLLYTLEDVLLAPGFYTVVIRNQNEIYSNKILIE